MKNNSIQWPIKKIEKKAAQITPYSISLLFINVIKFRLPGNIYVLYIVRVCYWFVSSILLFLIANAIRALFVSNSRQLGNWWSFGFLYIGVQLLMYAIMQIRLKKSFYNGVFSFVVP